MSNPSSSNVAANNSHCTWIHLISIEFRYFLGSHFNVHHLFTSHIFPVQSMEQVARKSPQECQEHPQTAWIWSVNVRVHSALMKSQILTVASPEAVAKLPPLKQIESTSYYFIININNFFHTKKEHETVKSYSWFVNVKMSTHKLLSCTMRHKARTSAN